MRSTFLIVERLTHALIPALPRCFFPKKYARAQGRGLGQIAVPPIPYQVGSALPQFILQKLSLLLYALARFFSKKTEWAKGVGREGVWVWSVG